MKPVVEALRALDVALAEVLASAYGADAVHGGSDADVLDGMVVAGSILRRVEGFLVESTDVVRGRSEEARDERMTTQAGCRSVCEVVQRTTLVSGSTANGFVRAAEAVHRARSITSGEWLPAALPALREAMVVGAVGRDGLTAAAPLLAASARVERDGMLLADASLADAARGIVRGGEAGDEGVDGADDGAGGERGCETGDVGAGPSASAQELRTLAQVWASVLDQDGAEPVDQAAMRRRGLRLGVAREGLVRIDGDVLVEVAAQLQRINDALSNPKHSGRVGFVPDGAGADGVGGAGAGGAGAGGDGAGGDSLGGYGAEQAGWGLGGSGTDLPGPDAIVDSRTRPQRLHDALATALGVAARSGELPTIGGGAPTLVVYAREEDVVAGTGWAEVEGADAPVSIAVAAHVACCGTVQRVTCDNRGRIVGLGVLDRVFNAVQRKAISLRDGGCVIPGCGVPAAWCEIHHDVEHARGGPTHTDNGMLLCWHHHRTLDLSGWSVSMIDGVPHVRGPSWWDPHRFWRPAAGSRLRRRAGRMATV